MKQSAAKIARNSTWLELAVVLLLFLAALGIRLYGLDRWPPGLYNDEAANGIDALAVLDGRWPVFFENNNGREPLFIYLQALGMALLGATPYALRATAAVIGALTAPALYWMTREAFVRTGLPVRWLAFWTTAFLVTSYWHVSLSRIGFRAIMLPLMAALAFGWFWRAWRRVDPAEDIGDPGSPPPLPLLDLSLCGVLVGASLYTYTAARFIPVVIVVVALLDAIGPRRSAQRTKRIALALAIVAAVALAVFAPLGLYFVAHPGAFLGRAASVSVLSAEFASGGPLAALAHSVLETAKMFFAASDPNLRHNPAQRPVFDVVLAAWIGIGIVVALFRRRVLPYAFTLAWLVLLAVPAVLSSEGIPHSLRAIGMLPVALLLAAIAMLAAGQRLLRRWPRLAVWLPLPFLLFSGFTGLRAYFQAWQEIDQFRTAFQTEYVDLARFMASHATPESVWALPISSNYHLSDAEFYTIEFFARDRYASIPVDEQAAPARLTAVAQDNRFVQLIAPQSLGDRSAAYVFGDPKHLLEFLLRKHGRQISQDVDEGAPYAASTFEFLSDGAFEVADAFTPMDVTFANVLKLKDAAYGRTALELHEPADAVDDKATPSGHPLWIALHWEALAPIDVDLKASLYLEDQFGNVVGQVDDLLVGDRYPVERVWEPGEVAGTYHILPIMPAVPPGRYQLHLKVYEDRTLRPYGVEDEDGQPSSVETSLGYVDVTRPELAPVVSPQVPLSPAAAMGPDLVLLGYDLPVRDSRPGTPLGLTLYWQAAAQPSREYQIAVELRDAAGSAVVTQIAEPANGAYPPSRWQAGEIVRDARRIPITTTLAAGVYDLAVVVGDGSQALAEATLGQVTVQGRPRLSEPPALAWPQSTRYGGQVELLGIAAPEALEVAPGEAMTLTLAWRALATPTEEIVRFVHLLGQDGLPLAQNDQVPCRGECPATSWLSGEVLVDEAVLQIPPDLPPGRYVLGAGWYNRSTLQRLPASSVDGQSIRDDVAPLPLPVDVVKPD